jgi:hypothetical protein
MDLLPAGFCFVFSLLFVACGFFFVFVVCQSFSPVHGGPGFEPHTPQTPRSFGVLVLGLSSRCFPLGFACCVAWYDALSALGTSPWWLGLAWTCLS